MSCCTLWSNWPRLCLPVFSSLCRCRVQVQVTAGRHGTSFGGVVLSCCPTILPRGSSSVLNESSTRKNSGCSFSLHSLGSILIGPGLCLPVFSLYSPCILLEGAPLYSLRARQEKKTGCCFFFALSGGIVIGPGLCLSVFSLYSLCILLDALISLQKQNRVW